jgi:hypothetical protein
MGMTRSRLGAVETRPPKSPPQAALYRWEGHEEVQRPGEYGLVFRAMTRVTSCEATRFRSGNRTWTGLAIAPLLFAAAWNDRSRRKIAPMKEDKLWNHCC